MSEGPRPLSDEERYRIQRWCDTAEKYPRADRPLEPAHIENYRRYEAIVAQQGEAIRELRRERDELVQILKPCHPAMKRQSATIARLRGLLKRASEELDQSKHAKDDCLVCLVEAELGDDSPDLNKCPGCGGPADNGHDRCVPPTPYYCTKCAPDIHMEWDGDDSPGEGE